MLPISVLVNPVHSGPKSDCIRDQLFVQLKAAFTRDLVHLEPSQIGTFMPCVYTGPTGTVPNVTASRTQMAALTKSIPFGTVPRKVSCKRVERFQMGTARNWCFRSFFSYSDKQGRLKDPLSTNKTSVVKLVFTNSSFLCVRSIQSPLCFETSSDRGMSLAIVQ